MIETRFVELVGTDPVVHGLVGGIVIATFNLLGALLIVLWRDPSERALDGALGFAAGIMLAASFTSLIVPGIEIGGVGPVFVGFAIGVLALDRADRWIPHVHLVITGRRRIENEVVDDDRSNRATGRTAETSSRNVSAVILFVVAITLHNVPEGLAVGVAFGAEDLSIAIPLMIAIGIQNVPEGFAVSVAARNAGLGSLFYAAIVGIRAGLVEIPMAVFGAAAVQVATPLLPYAMGFAAGAMLFVISDEIVPETHARGHERIATLGTMAGIAIMVVLDVSLE
ncbi:ZIP family metal transporter [Halovivax gelatinilyticus]|uniref:ZIP family metal transporter n=1 Tax=Halovivax gelatinilyticus TaxID=2961597 RepID=UPI0020CA4828|nr:ZIP family metal transporter [Halovivax gelatinilyticus]